MRYVSMCSGIEAATVAWEPLGFEPLAFAEVEEFPSAVLEERFPSVPNVGDLASFDWSAYAGAAKVVVGGPPCFPAGTLVMCDSGLKPIEEVRVGDLVITHEGRLKTVVKTGNSVADTIVLKGQGSVGIECTPGHPFYSKAKHRAPANGKGRQKLIADLHGHWTPAENMQGMFWLNVCSADSSDIPNIGAQRRGVRDGGYLGKLVFTEDFFYLVGRWLGDGWVTAVKRQGRKESFKKSVLVCCSHEHGDDLESRLAKTGLHFRRSRERTTERFSCSSNQLYDWFVTNFGKGAENKNIPAWCIGMPVDFRVAMVQGYFDSDGQKLRNGYRTTTVSRRLAVGMKMLVGSIGMASSVGITYPSRTRTIEGRIVNERPYYTTAHYTSSRSAFFSDSGFYGLVRKVLPGRRGVVVYNLEVEDDHSYTADGIAVHNCQEFSVSGPKDGLDGSRGRVMLEFLRACREIGPEWVVIENVPNLLSLHKGRDFQAILETMVGMWPGGGIAWRVLDAAFFSLPQRRRRLFVVVSTGEPDGAGKVLLDGEGRDRAAQEGGPSWEELARRSGVDIEAEGWCLASAQAHAELTRGISPTLTTLHEAPIWVRPDGTVRRLTPDEYEVLQGFERGWTDIPWKGRRAPDSLRYRAVGNSFPVPILRWIGERIVRASEGAFLDGIDPQPQLYG